MFEFSNQRTRAALQSLNQKRFSEAKAIVSDAEQNICDPVMPLIHRGHDQLVKEVFKAAFEHTSNESEHKIVRILSTVQDNETSILLQSSAIETGTEDMVDRDSENGLEEDIAQLPKCLLIAIHTACDAVDSYWKEKKLIDTQFEINIAQSNISVFKESKKKKPVQTRVERNLSKALKQLMESVKVARDDLRLHSESISESSKRVMTTLVNEIQRYIDRGDSSVPIGCFSTTSGDKCEVLVLAAKTRAKVAAEHTIREEKLNVQMNHHQLEATIQHFNRYSSSSSTTAKARKNKSDLIKAIQVSVLNVCKAELVLGLRSVLPTPTIFKNIVGSACSTGSWDSTAGDEVVSSSNAFSINERNGNTKSTSTLIWSLFEAANRGRAALEQILKIGVESMSSYVWYCRREKGLIDISESRLRTCCDDAMLAKALALDCLRQIQSVSSAKCEAARTYGDVSHFLTSKYLPRLQEEESCPPPPGDREDKKFVADILRVCESREGVAKTAKRMGHVLWGRSVGLSNEEDVCEMAEIHSGSGSTPPPRPTPLTSVAVIVTNAILILNC